MLTTVIGLIERWWREKPRLDVVRTVVGLRDAMVVCESAYQSYATTKFPRGPSGTRKREHAKAEWRRSINSLAKSANEVGAVFDIYSPSARLAVGSYLGDEEEEFEQDPEDEKELEQQFSIRVSQVKLNPEFLRALGELDIFIRQHFKVEEVHAVSKSSFR